MSISLLNDVGSIILIGDEPRRRFPQPAQILAQAFIEMLEALQKRDEGVGPRSGRDENSPPSHRWGSKPERIESVKRATVTEPLAVASGLMTEFSGGVLRRLVGAW